MIGWLVSFYGAVLLLFYWYAPCDCKIFHIYQTIPPFVLLIIWIILITIYWFWVKQEKLFQMKKWIYFVVFLFLMGLFVFTAGINLHKSSNLGVNANDNHIKICIINSAHYFSYPTPQDVSLNELKIFDCDIYAISEFWRVSHFIKDTTNLLMQYFNLDTNNGGYYVAMDGEYVILSKYPIINYNLAQYEGFLQADIDIEGNTLSLFNVHLAYPLKPRHKNAFDKLDISTLDDRYLVNGNEYVDQFYLRNIQSQELVNAITDIYNQKVSILASGDFNNYPNFYYNRKLENILQRLYPDNFTLWTYPSAGSFLPRILPLDHSYFYSKNFAVANYYYYCSTILSDHCMQIVELVKAGN